MSQLWVLSVVGGMTGIVYIDGISWEFPPQYFGHYLHPKELENA